MSTSDIEPTPSQAECAARLRAMGRENAEENARAIERVARRRAAVVEAYNLALEHAEALRNLVLNDPVLLPVLVEVDDTGLPSNAEALTRNTFPAGAASRREMDTDGPHEVINPINQTLVYCHEARAWFAYEHYDRVSVIDDVDVLGSPVEGFGGRWCKVTNKDRLRELLAEAVG